MVTSATIEPTQDAAIVRRFETDDGSGTLRERLAYLSHSDRTLAYEMIEGIDAVQSYRARLRVTSNGTGSTVTWHADITANAARVEEIAAGTKAVFEAGIQALSKPPKIAAAKSIPLPTRALAHLALGQTPRLGLSVSPKGLTSAKTICLFLHGIGGHRRNWAAQLCALSDIMPTAALDLRGYGDSTLGFSQTQLDDYFEDILSVMHTFGAETVVLCGLSYGAWIATSFALKNPDKVAGLVLCGGCTGMSEADPDERESFRVTREVPLNAGQAPADFAASVVDAIAGPNAGKDIRDVLRNTMARIPAETYRDALNCFCNPLEKLDFAKASFPVLLMTGEHDRLAPPAEIRAVSHRFADARAPFVQFEIIADAGHVCNLEQPDAVNAHLGHFLRIIAPKTKSAAKTAKKTEKRARILNAALREFSKNGYSGASMQAIAERADVSKPTLYQYIGTKEEIFRAVLDQGRATILAPFENAEDRDMVRVLWNFAWVYARYVLHPDNLSIARLIIGEAERVPDLARKFHEAGPAQALIGIANYLEGRRAANALAFDSPELAAEDLWSLILSGPRNHALHFPHDLPNDASLEASILNGLRVFLRAYSVQPDADIAQLVAVSQLDPSGRPT